MRLLLNLAARVAFFATALAQSNSTGQSAYGANKAEAERIEIVEAEC